MTMHPTQRASLETLQRLQAIFAEHSRETIGAGEYGTPALKVDLVSRRAARNGSGARDFRLELSALDDDSSIFGDSLFWVIKVLEEHNEAVEDKGEREHIRRMQVVQAKVEGGKVVIW